MRFKQGDRWVVLQTRSSPIDTPVSLKVWLARQKTGFWVQLGTVSPGSPCIRRDLSLTSNQDKQLLSLLETYASLFFEPQGLPPPRSCAHAINLLPNHGLVTETISLSLYSES